LLVPFDFKEAVDGYLLNLFCCKPDKAARLAAQGFLLEPSADTTAVRAPDTRRGSNSSDPHGWRRALVGLPYGALLADEWAQQMARDEGRAVEEPLFHYALAQDTSLRKDERFAALEASYRGFKRLCETQPAFLRLASLARVAVDYGARSAAVKALGQLHDTILKQAQVHTSEPFLAPGARFDSLSPGKRQLVPTWVTVAVFEELERNQAYSSYFSAKTSRRRLEMIRDLGFGSDEMQRRLMLIQRRFGA
jgi:hypothetical protein